MATPPETAEIPGTETPRLLWRSIAWWSLYCVAWLGIMVLLGFVALRIFYHDGAYWLCWFNAFTRYLYLPAWACLAWAIWQRRWILGATAAIVVAFHIYWLAAEVIPDRRFAELPAGSTTEVSRNVRIMFANVYQFNREYDSLIQEIHEADPDVVVLAEFYPQALKALSMSPLAARYPFGGLNRNFSATVMIMSKLPLEYEKRSWVAHRAVQTIDIKLGRQKLRIIGLHSPRPMNLPLQDYDGYWQKMNPLLTTPQGPLVIVGDFNATPHSLVYKNLQDAGLRSAHDVCGRGYATTWPNLTSCIPPIRIDQAMISPEIECEQIVEGVGKGSDHKPLILDVRVRQ